MRLPFRQERVAPPRLAARALQRLVHPAPDGVAGHRRDQHQFRHPVGAVPAEVACDLPAAGGVTDVDRVAEVEVLGQSGQVGVDLSIDDFCTGYSTAPPVTGR